LLDFIWSLVSFKPQVDSIDDVVGSIDSFSPKMLS
jgi:tetrahydromethanopterin S-methyltransferase subunit F